MPHFTSHRDQPWYTTNHLIKKIIIGKDITTVGNYAFCYAQKVTEVVFEEGSQLDRIGAMAFFNLPSLVEIILPETTTGIGVYAFGDCFALAKLYIPEGVSVIGANAFVNSTKIVLNVVEGSYAEEYAKSKGIAYTTR